MKISMYHTLDDETMIEMDLLEFMSPFSLTIPEARELYTKLTPILESHSSALAEAGETYETEEE